jgi:hypothetical protein
MAVLVSNISGFGNHFSQRVGGEVHQAQATHCIHQRTDGRSERNGEGDTGYNV